MQLDLDLDGHFVKAKTELIKAPWKAWKKQRRIKGNEKQEW